ncbi:energy-coupling factor ABC transporter ATP-binding protein [Salirhabdus salicampi]|uniref:energy-coupling factor ABC transporter ATP-binding protein n=1 Tax=Salirhabdus salicampi TaxID=476102 RepID=UPI0020C1D70C|nr:energy-coupling factor ABC transporter ATP-binding protein [Salirhabdus salicampi]MCP8618015.1 energy-coupling factor ABC transporter ATP-binding protein [Salirhabdus salicampi]
MDIIFEEVNYIYQPNTPFEFHALRNLSMHIPSGSFVAIIGHTGSGKSTFIQHLNGLLRPTEGSISIGPYQINAEKRAKKLLQLRKHVGMVFQYPEHQLFEETVEKDILFGPANFGVPKDVMIERLEKVLQEVKLSKDLLQRSPFDLSGGQMRRVALASVLIMEPSILVLDEPTAGLDPKGQKEMMNMFYDSHKREKRTTILVTHSMEDALKYADYVYILDRGKLYMEGEPEQIFHKREALTRVGLDQPEVIRFLHHIEDRFGVRIPYDNLSEDELAKKLNYMLKGGVF